MKNRNKFLVGLLGLSGLLLSLGWLIAQPDGLRPVPAAPKTLLDKPRTNLPAAFHPLQPGADDAAIAQVTARLLERAQYLHRPFDDTVSSNFLARLIGGPDGLDPQHIHFLQSDLKEFARYQFELDDLTLKYGDTAPAYEVYNRFLERLGQRVAYSEELLQKEKFVFTNDERITILRKGLPFPKDLADARQLWRERLRFEYLQEKLNPPATNAIAKSTGTTTNAVPRTPEEINKEIVKTLTRRYERQAKVFKDWDSDNVLQFYLDLLAHVYDPHSDYMGKAAAEDFAISMNLSLFGIGALLTSEDGYCKIKELKPGPALKDGRIKNNDRIVAVAQGTNEPVDVVEMQLSKVVQLIRGPKGTEVRLTVWPGDATDTSARKVVALVRDEIKLEDQEAKAKLIELPDGKGGTNRLGVINLPSFYASMDQPGARDRAEHRSTTDDVAKLLKKLQAEKVGGVILDLRGNGGGSLEEAIRLTGLFIRSGTVVQVRDPSGIVMPDDDDDPDVLYTGPLVVLTSRFSASASEIVAGALQDYGRALIVGDSSTHGKGTVQSLQQLRPFLRGDSWMTNDPGQLKVTIRKFYRPSGSSTQLKGVVPDIVLPSVNNVADLGETALDNPMPWDTIPAAHIRPVNRVAPYLEALRQRSTRRVAADTDYKYIREDMELYKKAQADKTVSLNEALRLKEKQENETRDKARKQERAARPPQKGTIYDLTLKLADEPGLPLPAAKTNSVTASTSPKPATETGKTDASADDDEDKAPAVDTGLTEAERILQDYISLWPAEALVAGGR